MSNRPRAIESSAKDRAALQSIVAGRNTRQTIVKRARIVLKTAECHGTVATCARVGIAKTTG